MKKRRGKRKRQIPGTENEGTIQKLGSGQFKEHREYKERGKEYVSVERWHKMQVKAALFFFNFSDQSFFFLLLHF